MITKMPVEELVPHAVSKINNPEVKEGWGVSLRNPVKMKGFDELPDLVGHTPEWELKVECDHTNFDPIPVNEVWQGLTKGGRTYSQIVIDGIGKLYIIYRSDHDPKNLWTRNSFTGYERRPKMKHFRLAFMPD